MCFTSNGSTSLITRVAGRRRSRSRCSRRRVRFATSGLTPTSGTRPGISGLSHGRARADGRRRGPPTLLQPAAADEQPGRELHIRDAAASTAITTTSLPGGTVAVAYSQTLQATGGASYTWSLDSGRSRGAHLERLDRSDHGTPTTAGTSSFTAKVTDGATQSDTQALAISVAPAPVPPPTITTTTLPAAASVFRTTRPCKRPAAPRPTRGLSIREHSRPVSR